MKRTRGEAVFNVFNIAFLALLIPITLYPFYYTLIASFSDGSQIIQGNVIFLPKGFTLDSYKMISTIDYFGPPTGTPCSTRLSACWPAW